jgi:hypothetical protein
MRNSQDLWIGVSRDLLITTWFLAGAFDEGAFLELCAGAGQRDQVGCVWASATGLVRTR